MDATGHSPGHPHLVLREFRLEGDVVWTKQPGPLQFVFPQSGKGHYVDKSGSHALAKGDVAFLDTASEGTIFARPDGGFVIHAFSVALEQLLALSDASDLCSLHCNNDGCPRIYASSTRVAENSRRLLKRATTNLGLDSRAQLLRAAASVLELAAPGGESDGIGWSAHRHSVAGETLASLSDEEILNSSVASLSRKLGFCRRHLNRMFKARYGLTHAAMKRELMLLRTASMLTRSNFKIVQVAEECGFKHPGRFHVWFRRRFGVSPAEWRRISTAEASAGRPHSGVGPEASSPAAAGQSPKGGARALQSTTVLPEGRDAGGSAAVDPDVVPTKWPEMPVEPPGVPRQGHSASWPRGNRTS